MKSRYGLCAIGVCVLAAASGCSPDVGSAGLAAGRSPEPVDGGYEELAEPECDPTREYAEGHECNKEESDCWVTGGGKIEGGGSFGGVAKPFLNGWVGGEWNHVTGDGHHLHGSPIPEVAIECDDVGEPGADHPIVSVNRAVFFGEGTWDGEPCYYRVTLVDRGEPGTLDEYSLVVAPNAWSAPYYVGEGLPIAHGNIQIHPVKPRRP